MEIHGGAGVGFESVAVKMEEEVGDQISERLWRRVARRWEARRRVISGTQRLRSVVGDGYRTGDGNGNGNRGWERVEVVWVRRAGEMQRVGFWGVGSGGKGSFGPGN